MILNLLLGLLVVVLLTAATGYFVAQEFAYVAADRGELRRLAEQGDEAAARAYRVTERLSFTLSGAQFGITVTALLVGYAGEPLIGTALADLLGSDLDYATRLSISVALVLIFSTVLQMVLGELAPKNYAIARTTATARALSRSTLLYLKLAGPIIRLFDSASIRLLRAVGIEPVEELAESATTDDIDRIIEESKDAGALTPDLSALLRRGLGLRDLTVRQVMTPRVRVETLTSQATVTELLALAEVGGHARFPVLDDRLDLVGVVGFAEALTVPAQERATTPVAAVARDALVVPQTLPVLDLLARLRDSHQQLAVVIDEAGGMAGVVTFEDIAEEVVGEILDEDDPDLPVPLSHGDDTWTVPASMRLDEFDEVAALTLPPGDGYETLSGLVMARLGELPVPGDAVEVVALGRLGPLDEVAPRVPVRITVRTVRRRVPDAVAVRRLPTPPTATAGDDGAGGHR